MKSELRMPMQDGPDLPEKIGRALWVIYDYSNPGNRQSYERIVQRRGFAYSEIAVLVELIRQRRERMEKKANAS